MLLTVHNQRLKDLWALLWACHSHRNLLGKHCREFPTHPTTCSGKVSYISVLQVASEIKIISISLVGLCSTFSLQNMVGNELVSYEQNVYLSRLHIKFFVSLWERTILHLLPRALTPVTLRRPAPPSPHPRDFSFDFHEHLTCLDSPLN